MDEDVQDKLHKLSIKALDALEESLQNASPRDRNAAADSILDRANVPRKQISHNTGQGHIPSEAITAAFKGLAEAFKVDASQVPEQREEKDAEKVNKKDDKPRETESGIVEVVREW